MSEENRMYETYSAELCHHGILGQRWGVRRYQNADGSLTEAGKKKYGYNLDVNDTSRKNVAKIRLGEAKRRLDYAKIHNSSNTRKAELQGRVRSAKAAKRNAGMYDKGAKLAAKGQTITGNQTKTWIALGASAMATRGLTAFLNSRMSTLSGQGRWTPGHQYVAEAINKYGSYAIRGAALAYSYKKHTDNTKIRAFNTSQWTSDNSIKRVGSQEYADRKASYKKGGGS